MAQSPSTLLSDVLAGANKVAQRTVTGKGNIPLTSSQRQVATAMLNQAIQDQASKNVLTALMIAGMFESNFSTGNEASNPGYVAPLSVNSGAAASYTGTGLVLAEQQAHHFCVGGGGFNSAISADQQYASDPVGLAEYAEGAGQGSYQEQDYFKENGAAYIIQQAQTLVTQLSGTATKQSGGIAKDGTSTGTSVNDTATSTGFQVGQSGNSNEDVWTAINRLAQDRDWYLFSDSETIYLADGPDIINQEPVEVIDRWGDADRIAGLSFTYDNTSFEGTVTHTSVQGKTVNKTKLPKVQTPTEASLQLICKIDAVRGGDVIYLTNCGPANGPWLVGDITRSVFDTFSDITLNPALAPIPEFIATGGGNQVTNASDPKSGSLMSAIINSADSISAANFPYVWGGGHTSIGVPDKGDVGADGNTGAFIGYDCSGSVSAVLGAAGLLQSPESTQGMIQALGKYAVAGRGSGNPEVTIWINPATHVFLEINGQYWGTSIGMGASPNHTNGRENNASSGPTWWKKGSSAPDTSSFTPYHIPRTYLATPTTSSATVKNATTAPPETMYDTANVTVASTRSDFPNAVTAVAGYIDGSFLTYNPLTVTFPGLAIESTTEYKRVVSITVNGSLAADCADIENSDMTPTSGAAWARSKLRQNQFNRPILYASLSDMPAVKAALQAEGLSRQQYRLWVADYVTQAPTTVMSGYDAWQWSTSAATNLDTSLLTSGFFNKPDNYNA